ncbi:MAG: tRNA (N(6)-L-threonylcarbamoyladenosine(37)-C(2))-methylthiotransferase MtaB, partial [Acidobacteria bacterium]|nr:tRNA (N(6)-L-threonylcarbamoyladenosine(37)-C(2))-methylthiotransferase MtaB [Acidobacteriota bacterium]
MTTFSIQSFGCRINQAEAFTWTDSLQENGLVFLDDTLSSDIVLVNTCTLTGRADRDVRAFIRKVG